MGDSNEKQPQSDVELSEMEKRNGIGELYHNIVHCFDENTTPPGWKNDETDPLYGAIGSYSYKSDTEDWVVQEDIPQQLYVRSRTPSTETDIDDISFMTINAGQFGMHSISHGTIKVNKSSREVISSPPMQMNTHGALELGRTLAHAMPRQK